MRVVTQLSHEVGHHSGCDGYSIFQLHTISNHHATVRLPPTTGIELFLLRIKQFYFQGSH